jgi:hypothetical protein
MRLGLAWDALCQPNFQYPYPNSNELPIEFFPHLTPDELTIVEAIWRSGINDNPDWLRLAELSERAGIKI